ncbi:MAG: PQQ-dependent sugar dehydrogenase [Actinobacteria bacterium]|nr:PQQ-dependent sugar dehydrogenase [Actinomycetota bacterium]
MAPAPVDAARPRLAGLALERVATGFRQPLFLTHAGDGTNRVFVVEKAGTIRLLRDGVPASPPFLDITDRVGSNASEQGLLGLAFHPQFRTNGRFFVNYTDVRGDTVVAAFRVSADDPNQADPESERRILFVDQPFANHNGGMLAFGPDGMLYIGLGDGGSAGDPRRNAQNLGTLLGKMLRIDVDAASGYRVPPDNPFVGRAGARGEIWAYGLRNPWRYAFDRLTGDLYIADVGQNAYEEIHVELAPRRGGQNYGWPLMEGAHCYPEFAGCDRRGLEPPVAEYHHDDGCSVTGGYVYRGTAQPALVGTYVFGDYCSGRIWTLTRAPDGMWIDTEQLNTDVSISSFGEDEAGEIYVTDLASGRILRVRAVAG